MKLKQRSARQARAAKKKAENVAADDTDPPVTQVVSSGTCAKPV